VCVCVCVSEEAGLDVEEGIEEWGEVTAGAKGEVEGAVCVCVCVCVCVGVLCVREGMSRW
jgi:hypothetical protein